MNKYSAAALKLNEQLTLANLVSDCYDEHDDNGYRMYLDGIEFVSGQDKDTALYVQATTDGKGNYSLSVFVSNSDDSVQWFMPFSHLSRCQQYDVYRQVVEHKNVMKNKYIKVIYNNITRGFDVPKNFAVPSILDLIQEKVDEKDFNKRMIGEVGMSGSDGEPFISVFYPDKENPSHSYDKPLSDLNLDEIVAIHDAMRDNIDNKPKQKDGIRAYWIL